MDLEKLFEGISERYQNLVLFMPIYQLNQAKHPKYKDLDLMEIGFSVLLFIIDKMLIDKGSVSPEQLNQFLQHLIKDVYKAHFTNDEINDFRKYLVDEKLRNSGNSFLYEHTDFPSSEKKVIQFDLITYDDWTYEKHKNNEIRLKLTQKGVELLFKTKEMFAEMQISITMLYFKQQLEKGAFSHALNAVRDLIFQIESQIRTIKDFEEQIKRNTLSAFNRKRIEAQFEKSYAQTQQEKEQFNELKSGIENVKFNYTAGRLSRKEQKAFETILEIDRLLNQSIVKHEILFVRKLELLKTLTGSIQLLIENAFSKHFHFEQEILQVWIEKAVTQEKIHKILKPVMPIKLPKYYHPFMAFSPQITKKMKEKSEEVATELNQEEALKQKEIEEKEKREEFKNELKMAKIILYPLLEKEMYFISDILKELRAKDKQAYFFIEEYLQQFLNISVKLHQSNYKQFEFLNQNDLAFDKDEVKMLASLTNEKEELAEIKEFEMIETENTVEFAEGVLMTDYIIKRKV